METVGEKIKRLRKRKGISQKELAALVGAAQATMNKIESGDIKTPSVYLSAKIANALDQDLFDLFEIDHPDVYFPPVNEIQTAEIEALKKQLENYEILIQLLKDKLKDQ